MSRTAAASRYGGLAHQNTVGLWPPSSTTKAATHTTSPDRKFSVCIIYYATHRRCYYNNNGGCTTGSLAVRGAPHPRRLFRAHVRLLRPVYRESLYTAARARRLPVKLIHSNIGSRRSSSAAPRRTAAARATTTGAAAPNKKHLHPSLLRAGLSLAPGVRTMPQQSVRMYYFTVKSFFVPKLCMFLCVCMFIN